MPLIRLTVVCIGLALCVGTASADHHEGALLELSTASDAAKQHVHDALDQLANVHFSAAYVHLRRAVDADPDFGLAHALLAYVTPDLNDGERARRIGEGISKMGRATTGELMLAVGLREDVEHGRAAFHAVLEPLADMLHDDPTIAYMAAANAGPQGSNAQVEALEAVAERFPDYGPAQNLLAYGYWDQGRRQDAVRAVRRYVELESDHANAHDSYAEIMLRNGLLNRSEESYRTAVRTDPEFFQGYVGLATALALQEKYDEARAAIREGFDKASGKNALYNMHRALANVYIMEGDLKGAENTLDEVVEKGQNDQSPVPALALAHYQLAMVHAINGNTMQARAHLSRAEDRRPEAWNDFQHGVTSLTQTWGAEYDPARETADMVEEEDFKMVLNGIIATERGDLDEGCEMLADAGGDAPLDRIYLAKCEQARGNTAAARSIKADAYRPENLSLYSPFDAIVFHIGHEM